MTGGLFYAKALFIPFPRYGITNGHKMKELSLSPVSPDPSSGRKLTADLKLPESRCEMVSRSYIMSILKCGRISWIKKESDMLGSLYFMFRSYPCSSRPHCSESKRHIGQKSICIGFLSPSRDLMIEVV